MTKKNANCVSFEPHTVRATGLTLLLLTLPGCAYLETLEHRTGKGDDRVHLGATHAVLLSPRDVPGYTCQEPLILTCEKGGGTKYYCHCVLY